ncbi:MAG: M16 family metallopeptidase [Alphaproteobacteria bacterium]
MRAGRSLGRTALLALLTWTAATLAPSGARAQVFNPTTFTLDNGLEVVVIENHRAPIATHMIWYKVGAADEPPGKSGIAHFLEHLMFKGTETVAPGEFSNIIARNGGRENAFTSYDYTGYFQDIAVDRLPLMMELEADRMTNLVLTEEIIEPERLVVLEERRQRIENEPSGLLGEQVRAATFVNHPYRLPLIGWEHEIRTITLEDVLAFYRTWYVPNNAVLIVAGDVDPEKVRALAERYYGPIPARFLPERVRPTEPPHYAPREVVMRDARVRQPSWSRRYLAPSYNAGESKHAHALEVLAEVIGGGTSSRLYRSLVVERELAASAGAFYGPDALDVTTFGTYFSPRPGVELKQVEDAMAELLVLLLEDGVTEDEVERAKQRMIDSAVFARDGLRQAARVFGTALASGQSVADVEGWPERIREVSVDDVNAAARAVLRPETSTTGVLLPEAEG